MASERERGNAASLRCRILGHKIVDIPWKYEPGVATLRSGERVPVTWACCEVCERCGEETWTPW